MKRFALLASLAVACAPTPPPVAPRTQQPARGCPRPEKRRSAGALWQRARKLERAERWAEAEAVLARGEELAPRDARFPADRGYVQVRLAEATADRQQQSKYFESSKASLRMCLREDPNYAECHHFLGEAALATGDPQTALDEYAKAIRIDPDTSWFYPPLAEELIALKKYDTARAVIDAGTHRFTPSDRTRSSLYGLYVLSFQVHQAKGDSAGMIRAMERARGVGEAQHPEILFNLGSTYAVQTPPDRDRALADLEAFVQRVCHSAGTEKFRDQCQVASALIQKLTSAR